MTPKPRIPLLSAALSLLVPGLGQLYCGRVARALAIAAIGSILLLLLGFAIRNGGVFFTVVTETILGSIYAVFVTVDAWLIAKKAPADYIPDDTNRWQSYLWYSVLLLISTAVISVIQVEQIRKQLQPYRVASSAMSPSLLQGDTVFADHEPYLNSDPKTGDLIVFQSPRNRTQQWLSRVIAQGGQTVEISNGELIIDGEVVPYEDAENRRTERSGDFSYDVLGMNEVKDMKSLKVPKHHVFLMSDNRNKSIDSRIFGSVGITSIDGRISYRYFPRSRSGKISQPE